MQRWTQRMATGQPKHQPRKRRAGLLARPMPATSPIPSDLTWADFRKVGDEVAAASRALYGVALSGERGDLDAAGAAWARMVTTCVKAGDAMTDLTQRIGHVAEQTDTPPAESR